jgi:hypothetical protein
MQTSEASLRHMTSVRLSHGYASTKFCGACGSASASFTSHIQTAAKRTGNLFSSVSYSSNRSPIIQTGISLHIIERGTTTVNRIMADVVASVGGHSGTKSSDSTVLNSPSATLPEYLLSELVTQLPLWKRTKDAEHLKTMMVTMQSTAPDLKFAPTPSQPGATSFYDFDNKFTTTDAETLVEEIKVCTLHKIGIIAPSTDTT